MDANIKSLTSRVSILTAEEQDTYCYAEGFKQTTNDSTCLPNEHNERYYKKSMGELGGMVVNVYVSISGIGIDQDYDVGGNFQKQFWSFDNYSFEDAYSYMVDEINLLT